MPTRPRIEITKAELERAEIPINHVLVKLLYLSEGLTTKGRILLGYNEDVTYGEGDSAHPADVAECYAEVYKVPQKLFFDPDDSKSMDWDCEMELQVGDLVWFSVLESKNAQEIFCEGQLYRSIPYADCYVAKRKVPIRSRKIDIGDGWYKKQFKAKEKIICLNGFVLCKPCYMPQISPLDAISDTLIDKSRGIVAFMGKPVKSYLRPEYCDIPNLEIGDEVVFEPRAPLFYLERLASLSRFDNGNRYWVVLRRRIIFVNNK